MPAGSAGWAPTGEPDPNPGPAAERGSRFWGKRYSPEAEAQSDFKTLVEGTRIKHALGRQSIKMYDKGGRVLRIEATSNDITFFRHHRKVVGRDQGFWF